VKESSRTKGTLYGSPKVDFQLRRKRKYTPTCHFWGNLSDGMAGHFSFPLFEMDQNQTLAIGEQ
jgi:hypothetical protein